MKILQICAVDITVFSFLRPMLDRLTAEGHTVHVACSRGRHWEQLEAAGYVMKPIRIARSVHPFKAVASVCALHRLIRREGYQMVHVHTPVAAVVGRIAARLAGVPHVVYTVHGFYFHDNMTAWKKRLLVGMERCLGKWTDLMITVSGEDARTAISERIMPAARVVNLCLGVDVRARFNPSLTSQAAKTAVRAELGFSDEDVVITYVGRMVAEKGVPELVEAFAGTCGGTHRLLLVGEPAEGERDQVTWASVQEKARSDMRIRVAGYREDIAEILAVTDIFVLPSHREGMPVSLMEAMSMGIPAVVTDIRGSREQVVRDQTGLIVPVRDGNALRDAIQRLASDKTLRDRMGKAARARAVDLYDREVLLSAQLDALNRMMKP